MKMSMAAADAPVDTGGTLATTLSLSLAFTHTHTHTGRHRPTKPKMSLMVGTRMTRVLVPASRATVMTM